MMFASRIPFSLEGGKRLLDREISKVQARVGEFLQQRQRLHLLGSRASSLSKLSSTSPSAIVLLSRQKSLLDENEQLQKDSIRIIQEAQGTFQELQTKEEWRQLASANLAVLGWAVMGRIKFMIETIARQLRDLANMRKRIDAHMGAINKLEAAIVDVENTAAGLGIKGTAARFARGYGKTITATFKAPLMVAAGIGALYVVSMFPRRRA